MLAVQGLWRLCLRANGALHLAGLSPAFAQMFPPAQQPGSSGSKGNQTSIYQSPFAAHPRSNNLGPSAKGSAASLLNGMPALPMASQAMNVRFFRASWPVILHLQGLGVSDPSLSCVLQW
jgi:hypothetical protein